MGSNFLVGQILDDLFTVRGDHSCGVVHLARVDRDLDKGLLYPAEHHAGIVHEPKRASVLLPCVGRAVVSQDNGPNCVTGVGPYNSRNFRTTLLTMCMRSGEVPSSLRHCCWACCQYAAHNSTTVMLLPA